MAKLHTLIDDFQDGVIDASKWVANPGVSETGGRIRITPSTSHPALGSLTPRTHDLTNSQIVAHIPQVTANGSTGTLQCAMAVDMDSNNFIGMRKVGSQLLCTKKVAGTETQLAFTPYSAVNHVFWRFRADSSNIYWETSPNGVGYFIQNTEALSALGFPLTVVGVFFLAGYSGFEAFPGTFQIEAVNPGLAFRASGASTSAGSLALSVTGPVPIAFSGASTSSGSLSMLAVSALDFTASGASTSAGTLAFTLVLAPTIAFAASGASTSSGSLQFALPGSFIASAASGSTGSLTFTIGLESALYRFSPPVAYDNPPTLPEPARPRYINAHARWKGGQARGRSVLKYITYDLRYPADDLFPSESLFPLDGPDPSSGPGVGSANETVTYVIVDTPTVDQMAAADFTYQGGHVYDVSSDEAQLLALAGFDTYPVS